MTIDHAPQTISPETPFNSRAIKQQLNQLHTVFDITVGANGIGDDGWLRMTIGIVAASAGIVWLVRVWQVRAGWRQMVNAFCFIGLGCIWLIVTLPGGTSRRKRIVCA